MLSILKKKNAREEELKKEEEEKAEIGGALPTVNKKKLAAEIRLRKEI